MKAVASVLTKGATQLWNKGANSSMAAKFAVGGFATDAALNAYSGDDMGTSLLKAGVTGAIFASNPVIAGGLMLGKVATDAGWGIQKFNHQKKQWWNAQYAYNNSVGGGYVDSMRAQTMRQAAVQAIQGSKMNARSALGGEAKILNPYSSRRY